MFGVRRPIGRLFYFLVMMAVGACAQAPPTTTVSDTVYRADGNPAGGTLLISWPTFITPAGQAVAAGSKSVVLGAQGALSVALVSNINATPLTAYYTVVYQLDDGTVKTSYWLVGTDSPTTIAAVVATLGTSVATAQMASRQYVDAAIAGKASDSVVVHKSGGETIAGVKEFSDPPNVPTPVGSTDVANKGYVDQAVVNSGSGSFVSKAGDSMTGPLLLPGETNDIKRSVYDRLVNAVITVGISVAIAMHDRWAK